jgi:hypothetical protein
MAALTISAGRLSELKITGTRDRYDCSASLEAWLQPDVNPENEELGLNRSAWELLLDAMLTAFHPSH